MAVVGCVGDPREVEDYLADLLDNAPDAVPTR